MTGLSEARVPNFNGEEKGVMSKYMQNDVQARLNHIIPVETRNSMKHRHSSLVSHQLHPQQ